MALTVLVTRPGRQAVEWVERLRAHGIDARALPLMAIDDLADATSLRAAWRTLHRFSLVMFVSPNAVAAFFAARPADAVWPETLRAGATGPGTVQALVASGVASTLCVAPTVPPYDSASLWARLRHEPWVGRQVLIVRGDGGRDEFAQSLRDAGATVSFEQAYRRSKPHWSEAEQALAATALAAPKRHLWLLSSSQAIDHLASLLPEARWHDAQALATHPRIAIRAHAAGFGHVLEASPTLEATCAAVACLESSPS